jgi:hypothetical protein
MKKIKDILKVIAYIRVFGLDLYGIKHSNLDTGKNNLESYFCAKKNWSPSRLKQAVDTMRRAGILKKEPAETGFKFYSLSLRAKEKVILLQCDGISI